MDTNVRFDPDAEGSKITLFVSSPGDVAHERRLAREVIARLNAEFATRIVLEPYFWEYEPFDFSKSFQEQIPDTAAFDVVLCLLWSRLGSRLGVNQKLPDGSAANSGTEYEITHALAAQKERQGLPELHVWINQTVPSFQPDPPEVHDERIAQWRALKRFIERWTKDSEDGSFVGSFTSYKTIADFQELLEIKLRKIAERRVGVSPGTLAPPPRPLWTEGSPFRGLEPFDFKHAPIFFGRTAAVSGALDAFRKTQSDKDDPRNFLIVLGASGSGKSSLARAGILPVLTEPGVVEGVGLWRRGVMKPSDAGGDQMLGLASAILSPSALPELASHGSTPQSLAANPGAIAEEIRSGLRVASEREQARQRSEIEALVRQSESENRSEDAAALRARLQDLRPPAVGFVLLVDQFEELFAAEIGAEKRDLFLAALAALSRRNSIIVVVTMRSDFFPRLAEFPSLLALTEGAATYHLAPPAPVELGQIIRRPAQAAGLRFDSHPETKQSLDEALRDAASAEPQALPLLEFALEELYKRQNVRGDFVLRWEDYRAFDGIEGVLAAKADEALTSAGIDDDDVLGGILSALVSFRSDRGESTVPIRRRADPEELASSPTAEKLVSAMLAARLLVSDVDAEGKQTISVAHEALLTRWPKAVAWFEKSQEFLQQRARVEAAWIVWKKENKNPGYFLPPGKPLDDALWLMRQSGPMLAMEITVFIQASERRANEDARRRARRKLIAVSAAVFLIGAALIGGLIAHQQRQRAEEQRAQANAYFQVHQAALHLARKELRPALALLASAFSAHPDFTTRSAFISALVTAPRQLETSFTGFGAGVQDLQFGRDETLAAAAGGSLRLVDTRGSGAAGPAFLPTNKEAPTVLSVARREDGTWLAPREDGAIIGSVASGSFTQSVASQKPLRLGVLSADGRQWAGVNAALPNETLIGSLGDPAKTVTERFTEEVSALAFARDGQLAVGTEQGAIFFRSSTAEMRSLRAATSVKIRCLAWQNQNEALLAVGDENGEITIIDRAGAAHKLANVPDGIQRLSWNPNGQSLAAACTDGTIRIWAISDLLDATAPPEVITAHKGAALSIAWSADGSRLASGGNDETVCIWRPSAVFGPLTTYDKGSPLHSLAVSPDGKHIAAGSENGDISAWQETDSLNSIVWHTGSRPLCLAWEDGRELLASGNQAGEVQLWQPSARDAIRSVRPGESDAGNDQTIWRLLWSPNEKRLAYSSHTGAVRIWEPDGEEPPRLIGKMPDLALGLAWSPDGATCAAGSSHGEIWLWNSAGDAEPRLKIPRQPNEGHGDSVSSLAFLRTGKILVSCGRDGTLRSWDAHSGAPIASTLPVGNSLDDLAPSGDEAMIAAVGADGYLRIWKMDGLAPYLAISLHRGPVAAVAWRGSRIFSASEDGTVRILVLNETEWKSRARQIIGVALPNSSPPKAP